MSLVLESCVEPGELDDTRKADSDDQESLANLNWLTTGDFLTFAAGIRQAA